MSFRHNSIVLNDKTFRKLFTEQERLNLNCLFVKGCGGARKKGYWVFIPGSTTEIRVFTEDRIVTCRKIDPTKGPNYET